MESQNYFKMVQDTIMAIPAEELKTVSLPVRFMVQRGEQLYQWVQRDRDLLIAAGLPETTIEALNIAAGALRYAEAEWFKVRRVREVEDRLIDAYEFCRELTRDMAYAFRNNPSLLQRVRETTVGTGYVSMIQALENCRAIGMEHTEELTAINFDLDKLPKASQVADEIADLMAKETASENTARIMRDRAYNYLKSIIDEICACGKYVFHNNRERYRGYTIQFGFRKSRVRNQGVIEAVVAPAPVAAAA